MPWQLSCLARAYAELGQFDDAHRCIREAMTAVETTKEKWCEAEVNRVAGEITLMSPDAAKAGAYFERAFAVSRQQQAKSWELRAAMSLARLWRDQGKVHEGHWLNNHVPIPDKLGAFIGALLPRGLGMATILIVEDQEQIVILAQSFLEEQGHKTLSAATADEALAVLLDRKPLTPFSLTSFWTGTCRQVFELAKRAVELNPRLKVVYSTGLSVTDDMKALFVPGSAVLEKPYTVDQLLTSLSDHFDASPQPRVRD